MTIHKLFTGKYSVYGKIQGFTIAGYGDTFAEAIDRAFDQIGLLKSAGLITN